MKKRYCLLFMVFIGLCGCRSPDPSGDAPQKKTVDTFRWRMVTSWPANFPVFQESAERFAQDVFQMSNGRLAIEVFSGNELVPPLQVFDAVSLGAVEMGQSSPYYWAGKIPAAQFFSAVPFGMSANGMRAWLLHEGLALWQDLYAPFNVIPFPMGNSGAQMGGWFNRKIESIDDFKGLRMRIPGLGGKVLKRAGGNPVLIAGSEVYPALERGVIDAAEWVGPFHDVRLGLHRTAKYYYYPGWHEPGTEFELIINRDAWQELPSDLQKIVEVAAFSTDSWVLMMMEHHNQEALAALKRKGQIEILPFSEATLATLKKLSAEVLNEEAARNPAFKKVLNKYRAYATQHDAWSKLSAVP